MGSMRRVLIGVLLALPAWTFGAGELDPSFGSGGKVITPMGTPATVVAVLVLPDGRLLAAGTATVGGVKHFALARYLSDGTLDATYGSGGVATTPMTESVTVKSMAVQSDGSAIVVGYVGFVWGLSVHGVVKRFASDGSPDAGFGTGGTITFVDPFIAQDVVVLADDRFIVATIGAALFGPFTRRLTRFLPDGSPDPSFTTVDQLELLVESLDVDLDVKVLPDDRLVLAGSYRPTPPPYPTDNYWTLARFLSDGYPDPTFGPAGLASGPFAGQYNGGADAVVADGAGGYLAVGITYPTGGGTLGQVIRFRDDGIVDATYGAAGVTTIPGGPVAAAVVDDDGRLVLVGGGGTGNFRLLRFRTDGSVDAGFGTNGVVSTGFAQAVAATAVARQSDGRLVVAGAATGGFALARYDVTGTCGNGVQEGLEDCDDGNLTAGDCCSPECHFEPAGTVCRPGATCNPAETCTGTSAVCPPDGGTQDADGDGICDVVDPCTNGGVFAASPVPKLKLSHVGVDPTPGNDTLSLRGEFVLPGATFADLDLVADGARVLLDGASGTVADVTLPPGPFPGGAARGWKLNRSGTAATYLDRTAAPLAGIVKLRASVRASAPARVKVAVRGKLGTYPVLPADAPVQATVVLGGTASSFAGECGETQFAPSACTFGRGNTQLLCRP